MDGTTALATIITVLFLFVVFFVACGYVTMLLWNFVIPPIIGWKAISFW